MLYCFPFIFFTIYYFKRRKSGQNFDLAQLIIAMYAVSGFFSVVISLMDMTSVTAISPLAAVSYVALLYLCIRPFAQKNHTLIKIVPLKSPRILYVLASISLIWFLISIFLIRDSVLYVLNGDMGDIRQSIYQGSGPSSYLSRLPAGIRTLLVGLNIVFSCPWISIFLAFFLRFIQKSPTRYSIFFILASLFSPIQGMAGADRSTSAYWIIAVVAMYVVFQQYMTKEEKKKLLKIISSVVILIVVYLSAMTLSRFGTDVGASGLTGSQSSLVGYFGQSFINFCYFFDEYSPPFYDFRILFPTISHLIFGLDVGGTTVQEEMTLATGFETGVFYTFIGQIMVGVGRTIAVIFTLLYALFSSIIVSKMPNSDEMAVDRIFLYVALCSIVLFGLFGHYYANIGYMASVILWFFILKIAK